ncbi:Ppx/GppA family phosphatase [Novosphingobium lentum]|uniref:Ppx/GppA family phosphatase n=1 Tax=Novosphingobium lentum TaxID=145287 RepID=UPI000829875A|nr:Ppx/GppA family phosphatase [Novosphingobium lentum]
MNTAAGPKAIIDIGSNSIRLVIFGGAPRAPVVLYNEKIMAGLGSGVVAGGRLDPATVEVALGGLSRFAALLSQMELASLDVVATAAVREAEDGVAFIEQVKALGLPARILSGEAEAAGSGYGVIAGEPNADGLVADMGGGSLELVRVRDGEIAARASFPLGALRIAAIRANGAGKLRKHVVSSLAGLGWLAECAGKPIYLVGGSWRTLARVHMHLSDFPLPVIGNYTFAATDARPLYEAVRAMDRATIKAIPRIKAARIPYLDDGAGLLSALVEVVRPDRVAISALGLREGLLYQRLTPYQRACDPLIEGVRYLVAAQQQVPGYAESLNDWLESAFADAAPHWRRLRHAACLLRGTGWSSNPDFRALGGEELALHGNWIGVGPSDRAMIALALYVGMGGSDTPPILDRLLGPDEALQARGWGHAIRLAQRISGGAPGALRRTALHREGAVLQLKVPADLAPLADTTLARRLARLAAGIGASASEVIVAP